MDNLAAAGVGGVIAGVFWSFTGPSAIAIGASGGIAAEQAYSTIGLDAKFDKGVDAVKTAIEFAVNMAVWGVSGINSLANSAWNKTSSLFGTK